MASVEKRAAKCKRSLALGNNQASDAVVVQIAPVLATRPSLQTLNLCCNGLTSACVEALVALMDSAPALQSLNLAKNAIDRRGCEALLRQVAVAPSRITSVNLYGNPGLGSLDPALLERSKARMLSNAANRIEGEVPRVPNPALEDMEGRLFSYCKRNIRIAIVGGGIGGLALSLALRRAGISCVVYEADPAFASRHQGYGLTLQQGARAIRALGIGEAVAAASTWSSRHFIFNERGDVVTFWGPTFSE